MEAFTIAERSLFLFGLRFPCSMSAICREVHDNEQTVILVFLRQWWLPHSWQHSEGLHESPWLSHKYWPQPSQYLNSQKEEPQNSTFSTKNARL